MRIFPRFNQCWNCRKSVADDRKYNGVNPAINTGSTAKPTPLVIAAIVAINGAIDHISHVILLGFTVPLATSFIYEKVKIILIIEPIKTIYLTNNPPAEVFHLI